MMLAVEMALQPKLRRAYLLVETLKMKAEDLAYYDNTKNAEDARSGFSVFTAPATSDIEVLQGILEDPQPAFDANTINMIPISTSP